MTGFSTTKSVLIYSFGCKQGSVHAFFSIDKLHFLYLWKFFPKNFHLTRDCFAMVTRWQEPLKQSAWRHKPYYSGFSRAVPQYSWCSRRTLLKISLGVDYSFINRTQNLFLCFMVYKNVCCLWYTGIKIWNKIFNRLSSIFLLSIQVVKIHLSPDYTWQETEALQYDLWELE